MGFCPCNDRKRRNKTTWLFCGARGSLRTADLHSHRGVCDVNYGAGAALCRARGWVSNAPVMRHLTFPRVEASAARSTAGADAGLAASTRPRTEHGCLAPPTCPRCSCPWYQHSSKPKWHVQRLMKIILTKNKARQTLFPRNSATLWSDVSGE